MSGGGAEVSLATLGPGMRARIVRLVGPPSLVQRTQELGLLEGEEVVVLRVAPLGDPIAVAAGGLPVSLRRREAEGVIVMPAEAPAAGGGR